jgi:osmotically inducible protein OsmC
MPTRTANAVWNGNLQQGEGTMRLGSGTYEGPYSFRTRFGDGEGGTNPEELIGAAHAGCFSMAFANILDGAGHTPERVETGARVFLEPQDEGFAITRIELSTEAAVPGIDADEFNRLAEQAKSECPVSQALAVDIELEAKLS